jgi:hypothetical protein
MGILQVICEILVAEGSIGQTEETGQLSCFSLRLVSGFMTLE